MTEPPPISFRIRCNSAVNSPVVFAPLIVRENCPFSGSPWPPPTYPGPTTRPKASASTMSGRVIPWSCWARFGPNFTASSAADSTAALRALIRLVFTGILFPRTSP
jgi:hypothetical protein